MEHSTASELREALRELRMNFHLALARRKGYGALPGEELRQLLANEPDDRRALSLIAERRSRISRVRMMIARLAWWR